MNLLIVGCGYVGRAVARRWLADASVRDDAYQSPAVLALSRSPERDSELAEQRITAIVGHWQQYGSLPPLTVPVDCVLVAVPHRADESARLTNDDDQHHVVGLGNLQRWLSEQTAKTRSAMPRLVYLSTTGVFGETGQEQIVDENTPVSPTRIGPRIAVAAEQRILNNMASWPSTILRLAGIYGPDRLPLLRILQAGQPLPVNPASRINLIHVEDVARAICWLLRVSNPESLYHLSDGSPVVRSEFYSHLARVFETEPPMFDESATTNTPRRQSSDKIVDATRFWKHSQLQPLFPNYRSGLQVLKQPSL